MAEEAAHEQQASRPSRSIIRRRRANVPGGRDEKIEVKVTAEEKELLRARGKLMNMSPQRLMVTSALGENNAPRVDYTDRKQAWDQACELRNLIAAIGNNMNQIARQANSDEQIREDFAAAVDAVMRAHRRVFDAFGETFGFEGQRG